MAIWDGLKALFFVLIGLSLLALMPILITFVLGLIILFICIALIVGYIAYKKSERALKGVSNT